jgi:hypothetical protein
MQEQLKNQLIQQLQQRAGLDQEKATQAANVVAEFVQQHAGELVQMATEGGAGGLMGQAGKLLGR